MEGRYRRSVGHVGERLVFISSPCIRVSSRHVLSRSSRDKFSLRRALSSAILFSSTLAWAASSLSEYQLGAVPAGWEIRSPRSATRGRGRLVDRRAAKTNRASRPKRLGEPSIRLAGAPFPVFSPSRSATKPVHLQNIVRQTHQGPLPPHFLQPPQQKLTNPAGLFDLSEYRLHNPFALRVYLRSRFRP